MGMDDVNIRSWLTGDDIAMLEKKLNPGGIPFPPPKSWVCLEFKNTVDAALDRCPPGAKLPELRHDVEKYLAAELNSILDRRIKGGDSIQIEAWKREQFPGNEPFSIIALGAHDAPTGFTTDRDSLSPQKKRKKSSYHHSANSTLPFEAQSTKSTTSTGVSGPSFAPTVNGELPKHSSAGSGPSPGRAASHNGRRRGSSSRGGISGGRATQPRGGPHVCDHPGCGKSFQYPSKLSDHKHTHKDDKRFTCTVALCNKKFKRSRELKAHEKTHPGKGTSDHDMEDAATVHQGSGRTGRSDDGHHGSVRERSVPTVPTVPSPPPTAMPLDAPPPNEGLDDRPSSPHSITAEHSAPGSPQICYQRRSHPWPGDRTSPPQRSQTPELTAKRPASEPASDNEGPRLEKDEIDSHIDKTIMKSMLRATLSNV